MDRTIHDYVGVAQSRITSQFKEAVNLHKLLRIWTEGFQNIQNVLLDVSEINDIETAEGYNLDVIGNIVGQPRELISVSSTGHFGFEQDPGAQSFGSLYNGRGGIYYSLYDPATGDAKLNDLSYRLFIRSKILLNNSGSTPDDIIQAAQYLFQTGNVELYEGGSDPDETAVFSLYIGRPWNDAAETYFPGLDETAIADRLLPRPAGVRIEYIDESVREPKETSDMWWYTASLTLHYTAHTAFPSFLGVDLIKGDIE